MNVQFIKLLDQADKFAKENRTQTISGPGNNYFELFHEKFAELIVRECARLIDAEEIQSSYGSMLKEHFGVEE